jgi:hypothetical protein
MSGVSGRAGQGSPSTTTSVLPDPFSVFAAPMARRLRDQPLLWLTVVEDADTRAADGY